MELSISFLLLGDGVLWGFFLLSLDFQLWFLLVEFHELGEIELRFLEELHLLDEDVLEWEDLFAFLSDFWVFSYELCVQNRIKCFVFIEKTRPTTS